MFGSRNEWFAHELQNHRREWTCPYCEHVPFSSKTMFSKHVTSVHGAGAGPQLEALILQCEEPVDKISPTACRLCNEWEANLLDSNQDAKRAFLNEGKKVEQCGTLAQFRRHLGRHMEQLALFALPIDDGEEAEDQSDSQSYDNESARSEIEQIKNADSVLEEALKGQSHPGHPAFVDDPREDMVNSQQNTQAASVQQFANSSPFQGAGPTVPPPPQQIKTKEERGERQAAIEEYNSGIEIAAQEERVRKEEKENEYQQHLAAYLRESGADERQIALVLKKEKGVDPNRPTYTRMSQRHLSTEILNRYGIDYEIDQVRQF
jgi:hypothetical protein